MILNRLALAGGGMFLLCITTWNASGQESDTTSAYRTLLSKELSEVVVSANRYGSVRVKTPEAIRVLDAGNAVRNQLRTTPEALDLTPGVFVQKTNHGGGSPFVRGLTGNQTLLMIDGIRLSNATFRYGPNQYFNTIDLFGLEKIEVLRGTGSVQYGSDAIGGTIQAFTHEIGLTDEPSFNGTVLARVSTHGMEKTGHARVGYSNSRFAVSGGISARDFGDLVGGDTTGFQRPTGYGELDFDLKAVLKVSETSNLTFLFQSVNQSDVPVYHKVVLENYAVNRMNPQQRKLSYLRYRKNFDGTLKSLTLTTAWQGTKEVRESRKNNSFVDRTEEDKVSSLAFTADVFMERGIWSSTSGIDIYNDNVGSTRIDYNPISSMAPGYGRGLYPDGSVSGSAAAFTLHTFSPEKWNISAGLRYNRHLNIIDDESLGRVNLNAGALVGNLSVLRETGRSSSVFISANTGFRAPNIDDLGTLGIVDFRYETPNVSLSPEHSLQYQAGYKLQKKNLSGEAYLYQNELYDLIVRNRVPGDTIEGYPVYTKENVERARIRGIETAWSVSLNRSLLVSGTLTWTHGQNITKNEPVRRIPPLFGRVQAVYSGANWSTGIELLAAAKQDRLAAGDMSDNRIPAGGTPGWKTININGSYTIGKVGLHLSLVNLLNEDYRYHGSGVNGMGRSAFLTVSCNF